MDRSVFAKKLIRYILLLFIAAVAALAGRKAVTGNACQACPGRGICEGEVDCQAYLGK
ncbi:MAG: hypothetical protein MUD02_05255 [Bacteroidales bacterium]|jgi:hypothetical protein|nr:hypothetical protein [Bacteroidales bacterium]